VDLPLLGGVDKRLENSLVLALPPERQVATAHLLPVPIEALVTLVLGVQVEGRELVAAVGQVGLVLPRALRVAVLVHPSFPLHLVLDRALRRPADGVDDLDLVLFGVAIVTAIRGIRALRLALQCQRPVRQQPVDELWLEPRLGESEILASLSCLGDLERSDGARRHELRRGWRGWCGWCGLRLCDANGCVCRRCRGLQGRVRIGGGGIQAGVWQVGWRRRRSRARSPLPAHREVAAKRMLVPSEM